MTVSKKKIGLLLLALFVLLLIFYWKDFYSGIVEGMNSAPDLYAY